MKDFFGISIIMLLILIFTVGLSWLITCGVIKLICLCFGFVFNWKIATGIWLVMLLISSIFKGVNHD